MGARRRRILPGFGLALGFTLLYFGLVVLIPLGGLVLKSSTMSWGQFWGAVTAPRIGSRSVQLSPGPVLTCSLARSSPGCWCATISR